MDADEIENEELDGTESEFALGKGRREGGREGGWEMAVEIRNPGL